ncbi:imidazole glycerol phosphate synthase subunit HisH [Maricaulis sp. CAU 1757]
MSIGLIDTGCANLASMRFALERAGLGYTVGQTPAALVNSERLILPGVGAAGPAMQRLVERGWLRALQRERRPLLGICLGMQMLFERSEEGNVGCLGLLPGDVERLPRGEGLVWPHMGWNALEFEAGEVPLLEGLDPGAYVYFVHGFQVAPGPVTRAIANYGQPVSALVAQDNIMGCQFHPERSGPAGARILTNFASLPL